MNKKEIIAENFNNKEDVQDELKKEISCGAFVIDNGKILLVQHKNGGHWSFPKGHMEYGETKEETAEREVLEETGIKIRIVSKKEYQSMYTINNTIQKTVIYFEAIKVAGEIKKQESEIANIEWVELSRAIEKLTFEENKELLKKFLNDRE